MPGTLIQGIEISLIKCEDDTNLGAFLTFREESKNDMRIQKY